MYSVWSFGDRHPGNWVTARTSGMVGCCPIIWPRPRVFTWESDNARYHHAPRLSLFLHQHRRSLQLLFLLPDCPDLNPIKRVQKLARRLSTHNRYFAESVDLVLGVSEQMQLKSGISIYNGVAMKHLCSRRKFLYQSIAALALPRLANGIPIDLSPQAAEFRRGGMVFRPLGKTRISLSLLGFGSHTDPAYRVRVGDGWTVLNPEGQARRDRQIARALDLGVTVVDIYENEGQWEPMSRIIKDRRDKLILSTAHQNPEFIGRNIDRAAKQLGGWVDLYRFCIAGIDDQAFADWDALRKAKEAGKVRAIGISTHDEPTLLAAAEQFEGLDYLFFPYNFIHARAEYSQLLPIALKKGIGLIAMKPVASGSIATLDPMAAKGTKPEFDNFELWRTGSHPVLPAAVAELTKTLDRAPDETLCMAALRFVYSKPFVSCALTGMFDEKHVAENYQALIHYQEMTREESASLDAARQLATTLGSSWLPPHYHWLEEQWRA
jgi:aryl-alcohol dehydrogenase-like predicted oxidoreductase